MAMLGKARVPYLLSHTVLEGQALYRVVETTEQYVTVEVVSAPGLDPGTRLRFTQEAVARMALLEEAAWSSGDPEPAPTDAGAGSAPAARPRP